MPSFEGTRYLSREEYKRHIDERIQPTDITVDEHYTFMAALKKHRQSPADAFASPVVSLSTPRIYRPGLFVVNFALLDEDLRPQSGENSVYFRPDGMIELTDEFRREDPYITEGYMRSYDDGMDDGWQSLLESMSLQQV